MNIGFDAKRAYQNTTGLGHYSRTLIHSLATFFPENEYYLFAPILSSLFDTAAFKNMHRVTPTSFPSSLLRAAWRSSWMKKDLQKNGITVYHGLSHEIPFGIRSAGIRSVVTIHDLIHERNPEQYNRFDVSIYQKKFRYACTHADTVIAISEQTKKDIIEFYKTPADKITVCYQSCNPSFRSVVTDEEKQRIRKLYGLPDRFFLYVGSIIERKNLLTICKALQQLENKIDIPLVVIGDGGKYKQIVKDFIQKKGISKRVIFLSEDPGIKLLPSYRSAKDFPAIYQLATCLIYPSLFEGFGIPVLEALCSGLPVITSNLSCLPETGGDAACYVDPFNAEQIAAAILQISHESILVEEMKKKGWLHAEKFLPRHCASSVMEVYTKLLA